MELKRILLPSAFCLLPCSYLLPIGEPWIDARVEAGAKREYGLPYSNIYVTIPPFTGIRVAE